MGFRGWGEIQLKITHSLAHFVRQLIYALICPYLPLPDKSVSLFKVTPLSQCKYLGGGTKVRICPTNKYFSRFKMGPVPLKRDGCLIPSLIGTYVCGAKNEKKTCY